MDLAQAQQGWHSICPALDWQLAFTCIEPPRLGGICSFLNGRCHALCPVPLNIQVNEETGNRRPVMLTLLRVPRLSKNARDGHEQEPEKTLDEAKEVDAKPSEESISSGTGLLHPQLHPPPLSIRHEPPACLSLFCSLISR